MSAERRFLSVRSPEFQLEMQWTLHSELQPGANLTLRESGGEPGQEEPSPGAPAGFLCRPRGGLLRTPKWARPIVWPCSISYQWLWSRAALKA